MYTKYGEEMMKKRVKTRNVIRDILRVMQITIINNIVEGND